MNFRSVFFRVCVSILALCRDEDSVIYSNLFGFHDRCVPSLLINVLLPLVILCVCSYTLRLKVVFVLPVTEKCLRCVYTYTAAAVLLD